MGVAWTEEQQQVIWSRDRNLLVSAAAGSGKTAVLVERIIQLLTDVEHPVDVDELLVVTFTDAAAAEMRERIFEAIHKKLEEMPDSVHLQKQAALLHSASITTIHRFCLSIIREYFHVLEIDPAFRVAEEGELKLIRQDVLDEMLEERYAAAEDAFLSFVEKYSNGKNDQKIEEIVLKIYDDSRSHPNPSKWLQSCVNYYEVSAKEEDMTALSFVVEKVRQKIRVVYGMLRMGLTICELPDGPHQYGDLLEEECEWMMQLLSQKSYGELYEKLVGHKWKRLPSKKDDSVDPDKKTQVQDLRKDAKKEFDQCITSFFYDEPKEVLSDLTNAKESVEVLVSLVEEFAARFEAKKRQKNVIDFSDMEQMALRVLTQEVDGESVPSKIALEYQARFYEVMIDEYQDSNLIQEAILTSVSKQSRGEYNLFMVGDVKQSIYRFRMSRPELFLEKYQTYTPEPSKEQKIDLHKNFRSRKEVLDIVNFIFFRIMKPELSKITYDKKAALYVGANYPQQNEVGSIHPNCAEYLFVDVSTEGEEVSADDAEEEAIEAREWEARAVATRIKHLMNTFQVVDKKTGEFRFVRYQDIVILTRSIKGWADLYRRVLMEEGIPAYVGSQEGYFETYEISVLLDYLKILDNFRQELPLVAVLTSPFVGFEEEALAKIRTAYPNRPFYEAILQSVKEEEEGVLEEEIRTTLQRFLAQYQSFRKRVPYVAIHELLWQILEETGYASCICAMQGGEQRMANLEMLMEKAIAFEGTSYKGLFQFVRYMERLQKYDVDYGEAELVDEQSDTVRILTIHKSKGLEFPVVFVAGMSKTFNTQDVRSKIVMHSDWGIGLEAIDLERRTKVDTVWKKFIQEDLKLENLSEELRVLYVALTRAKEKLILVGQLKDAQQKLENWKESLSYCDLEHHGLPQHYLLKAKSYQDWMLPIIGGWSDCIPMQIRIVLRDELRRSEQVEAVAESLAKEVLLNWNPDQVFDEELRAQLVEQAGYTYPYEQDGVQKAKVTVSELKRAMQEVDVDAQEMYAEEQAQTVPEFRKEEKKVRGISRGNAYHHLLQHLDFAALTDETSLKQQIDQLLAAGKLTEEMKGQIWTKDVWKFLESSVGRRLRAAKHIWKEQPFVLQMPATQVYPQADASETILMQGIMDAYFEEEDGIVLVDYKTDRVKEAEELKQRYGVQLQYYTQALEQLTKRKVKEKIIYSFALGKEIPV